MLRCISFVTVFAQFGIKALDMMPRSPVLHMHNGYASVGGQSDLHVTSC